MSYANPNPASVARLTLQLGTSQLRTRELRSMPHPYFPFGHAPSRQVSVTPVAAPAKIHQDVSTRFGQRLKELRTQRNLTQVRMAREFGVDRSYISDLERGRKSVSLPTMEIFALGLKLSLAELLTGI